MIKLFVTGDNHIGRRFDKYSVRETLIESRFKCLEDMVEKAEEEHCEFFVITGDLFESTYGIAKKDIKRVVNILADFSKNVLVLPGNHDFYTGNETLWEDFNEAAASCSNILLLNEYRPYEIDSTDGLVVFYPAYCDSRHSGINRLEWIKSADIDKSSRYNIGIAHGALEGLTLDKEGEYFPMSRTELHSIPVDLWLLGHAHVTEPAIAENEEVAGYTIFNPGTHEQLDSGNNTDGNSFVITLQNKDGIKTVLAKRVVTGKIRYFDREIRFDATDNSSLEQTIGRAIKDYPDNSVVNLTLSGSVELADYIEKEAVYDALLGRFLAWKITDSGLSEKITKDKIESEFSEIGFASQFLEGLLDDPTELQMAYDIVKALRK